MATAGRGSQVGRNDPCPCGSGKKYKSCCLKKQQGQGPRQATAAPPFDHAAIMQQAVAFHERGQVDRARPLYEQVLQHRPREANALLGLGQIKGQIGDLEDGISLHRQAIAIRPKVALYHSSLADLLFHDNQPDEAMRSAKRAIALDASDSEAYRIMALIHERRNQIERGIAAARKAMRASPENLEATLGLARLLERTGERQEALEILQSTVDRATRPEQRYLALKQMAAVHDKLGDYEAAFDCLVRGGAEQKKTLVAKRIVRGVWSRRIHEYKEGLTAGLFEKWSGRKAVDDHPVPSFLVGFPRSGTTMTEQVMAAHPEVVTSDEQGIIAAVKDELAGLMPDEKDVPARLKRLDEDQIRRLRDRYWREAEEILGPEVRDGILVDKNPLHLIDIGLINVLFPEARVIVALRDPRDVCLSCFMQLFSLNTAMINFLTWENTARFYDEVMDLWLHLRDMLTIRFIEIRYEDSVVDLESQARRILDLLGLDWDERVLSFHEKAKQRYVSTPSFAAVTEKIYTRATNRWRNYEKHYEPVMKHLQRYVDAFGYQ
ncbi:MAG: sulfotransferase [Phycisphaerales bacterium]|nr:MAG: sulfotransferase [Phycisphaerales bacterium]